MTIEIKQPKQNRKKLLNVKLVENTVISRLLGYNGDQWKLFKTSHQNSKSKNNSF